MANKPRHKMPVEERAKQFMPFAALKGLPEALAAKEKTVTETFSPNQPDTSSAPSHRQKR